MKFTIITLFPEIFTPILKSSILGRAVKKKLVEFELINLRDFGEGTHKTVDDRPFGGGVGMVLKADVLAKALKSVQRNQGENRVILLSASGKSFNQPLAKEFSKLNHIVLVCGHYEGVDQRFIDKYVEMELSIGDYVLTGGELPAMVVIDTITRLIPKVLEKEEATKNESFEENLLEYPQYTRPNVFRGLKVPKILLSGNHQEIAKWRKNQALMRTKRIRPDLLKNH